MKILYILQETRMRELDANVIVANAVLNEVTFDYVVIVNQLILLPLLMSPLLPPGIVHMKSIPFYIKGKLKRLRARGHRITCQNAESIVTFSEPEAYDGFMTYHECAAMTDANFCTNQKELFSLKNYFRKTDTRVNMVVSGNPRMMMDRAACERFYQTEIKDIKTKFGQFIFFASSLGPSLEPQHDNQAALEEFYSNQGLSEDNKRLMVQWMLYNRDMVAQFLEFLKLKSKDKTLKHIPVIVRPHPSDNMELMKQLFAPFPDVQIVYHGHVLPWLLTADIVLASTSTVLVESVSVGSVTISFLPTSDRQTIYEYLHKHDSNNVCDQAVDGNDLLLKIKAFKASKVRKFHTQAQEQEARDAVGRGMNTPGIMARTFSEIHALMSINGSKIHERLTGAYFKLILPTLLKVANQLYWIYARIRFGKDKVNYLKHKSPPMGEVEYNACLDQAKRMALDVRIHNLSGVGVLVKRV